MLQLCPLDEDTLYTHVYERYVELDRHAETLAQDLGIHASDAETLVVDIAPAQPTKSSDTYSLTVSQSLASLRSSTVNNNSTTGYVLWSGTPFFLCWLLYAPSAAPLRDGGRVPVTDSAAQFLQLPPLFSAPARPVCVVELGSGAAGVAAIVLANYVDRYLVSDQKAILKPLRANLLANISEVSRRTVCSKQTPELSSNRRTPARCELELIALDWERIATVPAALRPTDAAHVHVIALDVVYNDFLIPPLLTAIKRLLRWYADEHAVKATAYVLVHLRAQDILQTFLEHAIIDLRLRCYYMDEERLRSSRFALYYVTL
ncbi:FAGL174Wp [Eremothecium gossypii FDAG1]|nr:FAGL174Wp [Eremothecium gossypii FDAG1]